jgi:hypothetical protein
MSPYWYFLTQAPEEKPDILNIRSNYPAARRRVNNMLLAVAYFYESRYRTDFQIYIHSLSQKKIIRNTAILTILPVEWKSFGSGGLNADYSFSMNNKEKWKKPNTHTWKWKLTKTQQKQAQIRNCII